MNSTLPHRFTKFTSLPEGGRQSGYANTPVTKAPAWHGTIAWDALLNGMATGLFMAAAVSEFAAPAVFIPVAKVAYPVALVLLLVDLALLVSDLGDPLRFHHMLRVFKPRSPMSVGTWCLVIFSLPLTGGRAQRAERNGDRFRAGSYSRSDRGTGAWLRFRGLQGRVAQH